MRYLPSRTQSGGNQASDPCPLQDHAHGPRIRHEQRAIAAMLGIYCRDHHGARDARLCAECAALRDYAQQRLATCPFQEAKPVCNRCEVHCYSAVQRERVRVVMRYAGPRMPWRHPGIALRHLLDTLRRVPSLAFAARKRGKTQGENQ